MFRRSRGYSLLELLTVISIIGLVLTITIPAFGNMRRRMELRAASAELRAIFHLARSRAVARGLNCGLKFAEIAGQWTFAIYEDGDNDGLRSDDIKKGIDRPVSPPRVVFPESREIVIGLLDQSIKDPDGDPLSPKKSPVAFNRSTICSFSPLGESTPGTIYITDHGRDLWAVRVYGATGRIRVLRYDRQSRKWLS